MKCQCCLDHKKLVIVNLLILLLIFVKDVFMLAGVMEQSLILSFFVIV